MLRKEIGDITHSSTSDTDNVDCSLFDFVNSDIVRNNKVSKSVFNPITKILHIMFSNNT